MELSSKLIDLFDHSEGLLKLIYGFQDNLQRKIDNWGREKELVEEVRKLVIESERLKNKLQQIIDHEMEADLDLDDLQNQFIKLLLRAESLTTQFLSKSVSLGHSF